ncbi:MAG: DUF58 domain-containing protein [Myxococcales bacterium]|nr:DUF58 domain-containing protein [Myxococcales bacterium]
MIVPTRRLVLLALLPLPLSLFAVGGTRGLVLLAVYDAALLGLVAWDLARSPSAARVQVERWLPPRFARGASVRLGWTVANRAPFDLSIELLDDLPASFRRVGADVTQARVPARSSVELGYDVVPERRGDAQLGDAHLRVRSRLGLVRRQARLPRNDRVKVYPNVRGLTRHELAARRHRLAELGMAPVRRVGAGTSFDSLREYVPGDDRAVIAWKATARRDRLITRTYTTERSQNVLVVLDCGRLMTTRVDDLTRLDHAIRATLLLSYVTMKQGDYIGMLAFSDAVERYLPPTRGAASVRRMNEALYALEPRMREPSYERACRFLAPKHRKRSLIVILTDVIDDDASSALLAHTARFARHHVPLCVTLRNPELEAIASGVAQSADEVDAVYAQAVAVEQLARRRDALHRMRRYGVDVLDVDPRQLGPQLISRYLTLKQRALR